MVETIQRRQGAISMASTHRNCRYPLVALLLAFGGIGVAAGQSLETKYGSGALNGDAGSDNSAFGVNAISSSTTGSNNTAIGVEALLFNSTGFDNTASGVAALYLNTSGSDNTATGYFALDG